MRNSLTHAFSSTRVIASLTLCVFMCVCVRGACVCERERECVCVVFVRVFVRVFVVTEDGARVRGRNRVTAIELGGG